MKCCLLIVGPVAPDVGSWVDEPGEMQGHGVSGYGGHIPGVPSVLTPEVTWDPGRDHEAKERHHHHICSGK